MATTSSAKEFAAILRLVSAAVNAGITLIQLREKHLHTRVLFELVKDAVTLTHGSATRLVVNDRADVAKSAGADGVHLTGQSLPARVVRRTFGDDFIIGASTHSLAEARTARGGAADFVVFGPVFETDSKRPYGKPLGLSELEEVCRELSPFPVIALGGVTVHNAELCLKAGAAGISGISMFEYLGKK